MRITLNTLKQLFFLCFIFGAASLSGCGSGSGSKNGGEGGVSFQLKYSAESGGSVSNARQIVSRGRDGTAVWATPDEGYYFSGWNDGAMDNPRIDINITGDLDVVAQFTVLEYRLSYVAGPGGSLEGEVLQTVRHGKDGASVTAIPGSASVFVEWSDGVSTATRTDTNIAGDFEVIAEFRQTPWLSSAHYGSLNVQVLGVQTALIDWPASELETYNLVVAKEPTTDIVNYASFDSIRYENIAPPFRLDGLSSNVPVYVALEINGSVATWTSFTPLATNAFNGSVRSMAIDGAGTRYVGGDFTHAGLQTGHGVALPSATSGADHPLAWPLVNDDILVAVPDGEGGWYIGGRFTEVDGQSRNRLAQIDALGKLTAWSPSANNSIHALAFHAGAIYAGGAFNRANGELRDHLAAFDIHGELLEWSPGTNNPVWALAVDENIIYAGGWFNFAGGEEREYLAAFSTEGELLNWNPGTDGAVIALSIDGGTVYGGGRFTHAAGVPRHHLAAFGASGQLLDWAPNAGGSVNALAVHEGVIYAGGRFAEVNGEPRMHLAAFSSSGELLDWSPVASSDVYTLAVDEGVIYVGGQFTRAGGQDRRYFAAFNKAGELLDWNPQGGNTAEALAISESVVYAGGQFAHLRGQERMSLAAFDRAGTLLDWNPGADDSVHTIAVHDGAIYVAGPFTAIADQARHGLARLDSSGHLEDWSPDIDGVVYAIATKGQTVYLGGWFTSVNGESRGTLAAVDTQGTLLNWDPGTNGTVTALAVDGTRIYAGGTLGYHNGRRRNLAAFEQDGGLLGWRAETSEEDAVRALAIENGTVYAAFTGTNGTSVAAFDAKGEKTWQVQVNIHWPRALHVTGDRAFIAGGPSEYGSEPSEYVIAVDRTGQLQDWSPDVNATVFTLGYEDGVLIMGGGFTRSGNQPRGHTTNVELDGERLTE